MAITPQNNGKDILLTNGDVTILKEVQTKFGIKSAEDALAFILQVARDANGKPIGYKSDEGWVGFRPSPSVSLDQPSSSPSPQR